SGCAFGQRGAAAGEIGLGEVNEAIEPGFGGAVVGTKVLVERAVALLQPQRGQRAAAEVLQSQLAARLPQLLVQRGEVVRRGPDLVAEFAGESGAREDRGRKAHRRLPDLEQLE